MVEYDVFCIEDGIKFAYDWKKDGIMREYRDWLSENHFLLSYEGTYFKDELESDILVFEEK